jgi:DNA-binding XRE family transcriptional regulator
MVVSRLVCWYFNGPYPDDGNTYQAAHLDCDPGNNNWWNLEWQTPIENMAHPITKARVSGRKESWIRRREMFSPEKLIAFRKANDLSRKELGNLIGVDPTAVGQWELGHQVPYAKNIQRLADVLGIEVVDLLRRNGV